MTLYNISAKEQNLKMQNQQEALEKAQKSSPAIFLPVKTKKANFQQTMYNTQAPTGKLTSQEAPMTKTQL